MGLPTPDIWALGNSPIRLEVLKCLLSDYRPVNIAAELFQGFACGFRLHYTGPRQRSFSKNLISATHHHGALLQKIKKEVDLGRIMGPFKELPIANLRVSPIGVVPKSDGGWRMITHLSHPRDNSVNDFIDQSYCTVCYTSFDQVIEMVAALGKGAQLGKLDIKSAFRLLPVFPGDFDLLGLSIDGQYYIDKCLPMGCSSSCSIFEKFSTFLQEVVTRQSGLDSVAHYLDDFIFAGRQNTRHCEQLMKCFSSICSELGVPLAIEKSEGPITSLTFLGLEIDTEEMFIRIPQCKLESLQALLEIFSFKRKITLRELQSLVGALNFFCKAIRPGRAFLRRLYDAMIGVKNLYHHIRINEDMFKDIQLWLGFLKQFNGVSYFLDSCWSSNEVVELYTDSAGSAELGCGAYFAKQWMYFSWPSHWHRAGIMSDITFLECVPVFLALLSWGSSLANKKILFHIDNKALVSILNKQTSKSKRVMALVRPLVLCLMKSNIVFRAQHIPGSVNTIADAISRRQWKRFRMLAPEAREDPEPVPPEFVHLIYNMKLTDF